MLSGLESVAAEWIPH